jgi:methionyl-tRNA formyltransferase
MGTLTLGPCKRLVLLGGGRLLARFAQMVHERDIPVAVITSPRHAGEAMVDGRDSLVEILEKVQIPVHVVEDMASDEGRAAVGGDRDGLFLSIGAAWKFTGRMLEEMFQGTLLNLHGTRLPQYRGGGMFSWKILNDDRLGFCLLHKVDPGLDTGDLVAWREFLYPSGCRVPADYMDRYEAENMDFLHQVLLPVFSSQQAFSLCAQPEYMSTYWPRLNTAKHGWVDWSLPIDKLDRFVCAFDDPFPGAQTLWNGKKVHLKKCLVNNSDSAFHPFQNGLVYRNNKRWLNIAAQGGNLIVEAVTDEAGRDLIEEIPVGDRLSTPRELLEKAWERVVYTPTGLNNG